MLSKFSGVDEVPKESVNYQVTSVFQQKADEVFEVTIDITMKKEVPSPASKTTCENDILNRPKTNS